MRLGPEHTTRFLVDRQCTKYWNHLLSFHFQITVVFSKKKKALKASKSEITKCLLFTFSFPFYAPKYYGALVLSLYFSYVHNYTLIYAVNKHFVRPHYMLALPKTEIQTLLERVCSWLTGWQRGHWCRTCWKYDVCNLPEVCSLGC